jgi:RNA polymerase sigma-70 factor (ECF subfamily)
MNIEELYKTSKDKYVITIYKIVKKVDVAEEIVQDAFLRSIKYHHTYDENKGPLNNWFARILYHTLFDHIKKEVTDSIENHRWEEDKINYQSFIENFNDIQWHIEHIKDIRHRQVLTLYFLKNNTSTDIEELTGIRQGNIRQIVKRFRDQYKSLVG